MKYLYKWYSLNNGVSRVAVVVNPDHPGADYGFISYEVSGFKKI